MDNNDDIHIRELMLRKLLYSIDDTEELELQRLLREDPEAQKLWQELLKDYTHPRMRQALSNVDEEREWEKMEARLEDMPVRNRSRLWVPVAAAAAILIILVGNRLLFVNREDKKGEDISLAPTGVQLKLPDGQTLDISDKDSRTYHFGRIQIKSNNGTLTYMGGDSGEVASITVPATKAYKISLADGSIVWLNSGTSLEFPFRFGARREVKISGEAYFQVAHNNRQPFIVHTAETDIEVLGTEFNVNTYDPGLVKAFLVTGKISTKSHEESKPILLQPGQVALYSRKQGFVVQRFPAEQPGWRQGVYTFEGSSLQEISKVLYRCYGIETVFERPQLAALTFTGVLKKSAPIEDFLTDLRVDDQVAIEFQNGVLHVK